MARYIDANKLVEMYERAAADEWNQKTSPSSWADAYECVIADIDDQPTLNVAIVKHAKWILEYGTYGKIICSECKNEAPITNKRDDSLQLQTLYVHSPYCPHCGARMDGTPKERGRKNE